MFDAEIMFLINYHHILLYVCSMHLIICLDEITRFVCHGWYIFEIQSKIIYRRHLFPTFIDCDFFIIFTNYYYILTKSAVNGIFPLIMYTHLAPGLRNTDQYIERNRRKSAKSNHYVHAYFNFPSIESIHLTMDLCCQTTD